MQTFTAGAQCTANFVFYDASNVYLGQAAHCSGTGSATDTNGCTQRLAADRHARRHRRQQARHHGLQLVADHAVQGRDRRRHLRRTTTSRWSRSIRPTSASVNPSIPFWGGPTGVSSGGTAAGDTVLSYGNSELRGGVTQLSPKQGKSVGDDGNGWSHTVYTVTPGIPGDSGSAFLDASGKALGVLSTVAIAPLAGSNGVGDVAKELAYANSTGGFGVTLAQGTEAFTGPLLPI